MIPMYCTGWLGLRIESNGYELLVGALFRADIIVNLKE